MAAEEPLARKQEGPDTNGIQNDHQELVCVIYIYVSELPMDFLLTEKLFA